MLRHNVMSKVKTNVGSYDSGIHFLVQLPPTLLPPFIEPNPHSSSSQPLAPLHQPNCLPPSLTPPIPPHPSTSQHGILSFPQSIICYAISIHICMTAIQNLIFFYYTIWFRWCTHLIQTALRIRHVDLNFNDFAHRLIYSVNEVENRIFSFVQFGDIYIS